MTQKELSAEEAILQKKSEKGPFPIFSEAKRGRGGGSVHTSYTGVSGVTEPGSAIGDVI